ncbi:RagB/SusD family nutrient uptake outer membrane protein [Flavivirga jejuensis]
MVITSCQDVLDKEPLDLITDATVWNDPVLIEAFLTNQYSLTSVMVNESSSYIAEWGVGSPITDSWDLENSEQCYGPLVINNFADEGKGGWDIAGNGVGNKAGRMNVNSNPLPWWENAYYIIRNLNMLIERLPDSPIDSELAASKIAEARFLRAFNYFQMVKRYGGVPLITNVQSLDDSEEELYPARNKEQEVYDFIISECTDIANILSSDKNFGRPCKWTALHLQSRAALYAGSIAKYGTVQLEGLVGISASPDTYFQISYDAANEIINDGGYALLDEGTDKVMNFRNVFVTKNHSEVIFAKHHNYVDALGGGGGTWGYDFVQRPKPHAWNIGMGNTPYLEMAEAFEYKDGSTGTLDRALLGSKLWSMDELWGNKDPRFFATLWTMETPWRDGIVDFHSGLITPDGTVLNNQNEAYNGVSAWGDQWFWIGFGTGFGVMKYLDEDVDIGSTWSNSGTDYQVFRLGETLLNYAEAAMELGYTGDALTAVNQIRTRAGIATLGSVTLDQIRHERRVELAFEGHRYWDLRRWRIATTELTRSFSGLKYVLDYTTQKYKVSVINNYDGTTDAPNFYEKMYYFPISLSRTGANSNLIENPGYN